jgi:uncharacterized protein involved in exopolysaccharide biosynthesis
MAMPNKEWLDDEISLRDLYLILKKGLPIIVGVAFLAAAVTYVYSKLQPPVYEAQSTVVITPSTLEVTDQNGVTFAPRSNMPFESYESLALSEAVLLATLESFVSTGIVLAELRSAAEVEALFQPSRPENTDLIPLTVTHNVRHRDPEMAAALTRAWTETALQTVKDSMLSSLNSVDAVTTNQLSGLKGAVDGAEAAFWDFHSTHNLTLLEELFTRLSGQVATTEIRISNLEAEVKVTEARVNALSRQLEDELLKTTALEPTSEDFLAGLSLGQTKEYLEAQLETARQVRSETRRALDEFDRESNLTLVNRRVDLLNDQLANKEARLREIPGGLERVQVRINNLERQLADQVQFLERRDTLLASPMLSELPRRTGQSIEALIGMELASEVLNPVHTTLLSELVTAQVRRMDLLAEQSVLSTEITELKATLDRERQELIRLTSQRRVLAIAFDEADERFQLASKRSQQLGYTALDPRAGRSLRDTTPEVLALQDKLRQETVSLIALGTEIEALKERLEIDRERLANIQRERATVREQSDLLNTELEDARAAYRDVVKLQPITSYMTELAPASAQVIRVAGVPAEPVGSNTMLHTALALVLGGMLATLFVFLREAVSVPVPARSIEVPVATGVATSSD